MSDFGLFHFLFVFIWGRVFHRLDFNFVYFPSVFLSLYFVNPSVPFFIHYLIFCFIYSTVLCLSCFLFLKFLYLSLLLLLSFVAAIVVTGDDDDDDDDDDDGGNY